MKSARKLFGAYYGHAADSLKKGAELPYLDGGYPGDGKDTPVCDVNYDLRTMQPASQRLQ